MSSNSLLAIVLLCPLAAWAADQGQPLDIKPGLWEMSVRTQIPEPAMRETSAEMHNISNTLPFPAGSNITYPPTQAGAIQGCVTKDAFPQALVEVYPGGGPGPSPAKTACTQKVRSSSASKVKIHIDCTNGSAARVISEVVVERVNAEEIKGAGTVTYLTRGRPFVEDWSMTGKFVSAGCGGAKPADQ